MILAWLLSVVLNSCSLYEVDGNVQCEWKNVEIEMKNVINEYVCMT